MQLARPQYWRWPAWLVDAVRGARGVLTWASEHTLAGIPLDWIARFFIMIGLYWLLRARLSQRTAAGVAATVLIAKELLDIVGHMDLRPRAPDAGDLADVLSGLAGIAAAMLLERRAGTSALKQRPSGKT